MELTKEHFERTLKALATKADLKGLVTKGHLEQTLAASEKRIIKRIDDAQEELARMVSDGFEDLQRRLDVRELVQSHERKLKKIEEALHITL